MGEFCEKNGEIFRTFLISFFLKFDKNLEETLGKL